MERGLCKDVQTMAAWGLQQIWSVCEAMWRCNLQVHSGWLMQTGQGLSNASDLTWKATTLPLAAVASWKHGEPWTRLQCLLICPGTLAPL